MNVNLDEDATSGWFVVKWITAGLVAVLIAVTAVLAAVGGSHNSLNAGVLLATAFAMLPAGIYGFGARSQTSITIGGIALFVVSGMAWGLFLLGYREHADAGVFVIPAFFITLISSCMVAGRDGTLTGASRS
jgi:hypothetical protein